MEPCLGVVDLGSGGDHVEPCLGVVDLGSGDADTVAASGNLAAGALPSDCYAECCLPCLSQDGYGYR